MSKNAPHDDQGDVARVSAGYLGDTPPPGKLPSKGQWIWVDRPEQLLLAADQLRQGPVVAIDAEFTQARSHYVNDSTGTGPRLAVLQLAIEGSCFVVDALRLRDLSPLNAVVENPDIPILLHGAGADLRVMAERELLVAHYFDLEATSRSVFGQRESSLAAMLQRAFKTRLDKSLQRTDWTRRPLPPAMVAYAARDAEMTLALYYWLLEHYAWALKLHESTNLQEPVAEWIEPLLRGQLPLPADQMVEEAIEQGQVRDQEQVLADCRAALKNVTHPGRKSRLLRLITDLGQKQLIPEIKPLLQASTADVRSAAARALSRLEAEDASVLIEPLLHDPVADVRKAALVALEYPATKDPNQGSGPTVARSADGTRSWSVGESTSAESPDTSDDNDWRARLRTLMGE